METSRIDFKQWMWRVKEGFAGLDVPQLKTPFAKALYVAAVTTIFTFLGCWAVLAYQDAPAPSARSMGDEKFAIKAAHAVTTANRHTLTGHQRIHGILAFDSAAIHPLLWFVSHG